MSFRLYVLDQFLFFSLLLMLKYSLSYPVSLCRIADNTESDEKATAHIQRTWPPIHPLLHSLANSRKKDADEEEKTAVIDQQRDGRQVLVSLCKSLMLYGAPCHRIVSNSLPFSLCVK